MILADKTSKPSGQLVVDPDELVEPSIVDGVVTKGYLTTNFVKVCALPGLKLGMELDIDYSASYSLDRPGAAALLFVVFAQAW